LPIVSTSTDDGAVDVQGCDIDIDMMATMLISMPSIIKIFLKYQLSKLDVLKFRYIGLNIDISAMKSV
jgi:hypothetical protein